MELMFFADNKNLMTKSVAREEAFRFISDFGSTLETATESKLKKKTIAAVLVKRKLAKISEQREINKP